MLRMQAKWREASSSLLIGAVERGGISASDSLKPPVASATRVAVARLPRPG